MSQQDILTNRANRVMVGGVASGWNSFYEFGAKHFKHAEGTYIYDVEGKRYIDYCMGWASLFLGHNSKIVGEALQKALELGFGFQYETEYHVKLAELITEAIPCADKVRFANSGTEANIFATRIARCATGRQKILKFEGHFHGVLDNLLFSTDTSPNLGGMLANGDFEAVPGSKGIPNNTQELILIVPFNDINSFRETVERHKTEIAAVIMEPICLASAVIYPDEQFLKEVRDICTREKIVLIFDEVMTGFRRGFGVAQSHIGVTPDLTTLGKIIGCGFPVAAVVGKVDLMNELQPIGKGQASGTNTGRLMSILGSYYVLSYLKDNQSLYEHLNINSDYMINQINMLIKRYGIKGFADGYAGRIVTHFGFDEKIQSYRQSVDSWNKEFNNKCYKAAYEKGLYGFFLPLGICPEPITITPMHKKSDIDETLEILESIFKCTPYRESTR